MRIFLSLLFICLLAFTATFNGPAFSQRAPAGCGKTDSTAGTLSCLNRETQQAQDKLSATFKTVIESQDEPARAQLNDAQKDWIMYRDAQCKWESGLSPEAALTRVYELSCVKELTEARIDLLQKVQEREENKAPREFGRQPRWMNVLANDYPDIFWRYGEWKSVDLDCDEQDEEIMAGVAVAHIRDAVVVEGEAAHEKAHHEIEIVVALAENPQTGRPKVKLVKLPVTESPDIKEPHVCRPAVKLEIADGPQAKKEASPGGEEEGKEAQTNHSKDAAQPVCQRRLKITDGVCEAVTIWWNGKDYSVLEPQAAKEAL